MQVDTLPNGLTVVTVRFDSPGIVAYYTLVGAGSRDEVEPGKSGYAHLFEHLMFRGTDQVSVEEYQRRIQAMGADNNANTTNDLHPLHDDHPEGRRSTISSRSTPIASSTSTTCADKYKDETGAVLGERNKVVLEPRGARWTRALRALAFRGPRVRAHDDRLEARRRGHAEPYAYSLAFFKRFYTPDDATIFVVGDFDRAHALEKIKAAYGGWAGKRAKTNVKAEPEQKKPRAAKVDWEGPSEPRLWVTYKSPAMSGIADTAALATLIAATCGEPSELYQRLVVRDAEAPVARGRSRRGDRARTRRSSGCTALLKGSTSFDEIIGAVQGAVDAVARGEMPAATIEAARDHVRNAAVLRAQTPGALASLLAWLAVTTGDPHGLEKWMNALAAVKPEDVQRVAKTLVPAHRDVVTLVSAPHDAKEDAAKKDANQKGGAKK